jgi:predicted RNA binding protein YcfA (HicA-like mRNA interferase family)
MSKFPVVNGKKAVAALERPGFRLDRVEGSHRIMIKDGHRWTVPVPVHGSRSILKGTLRSIIRMAGVTKKQFYAHVR